MSEKWFCDPSLQNIFFSGVAEPNFESVNGFSPFPLILRERKMYALARQCKKKKLFASDAMFMHTGRRSSPKSGLAELLLGLN